MNRLFKDVGGCGDPQGVVKHWGPDLGLKGSEEESCEHWGFWGRGVSSIGGVALGRRELPASKCRFRCLNPSWTSFMPWLPHLDSVDNN